MKSVSFNLIAFILPILAQRTSQNQYYSPTFAAPAPASDSVGNEGVEDRMFNFIPWFWIFSQDIDDRSNINNKPLLSASKPSNPTTYSNSDNAQKISYTNANPRIYQSENSGLGAEQHPNQEDPTKQDNPNIAGLDKANPEDLYSGVLPNEQQPNFPELTGSEGSGNQNEEWPQFAVEAPESYGQQTPQDNTYSFNQPQLNDITFQPSNPVKQEQWAVDPPETFREPSTQDDLDTSSTNSQNDQSNASTGQSSKFIVDSPRISGIPPTESNPGDNQISEIETYPSFLYGPKNPVPPPFAQRENRPNFWGKSDTCNKRRFRFLIGSTYDPIGKIFYLNQVKLGHNSLPKGTRVIAPTTPVTSDFRPNRLNVIYEKDSTNQNKVTKLECS